MKWEPSDWIRFVALIGALILFGVGTWMMVVGISAEGEIDIKSSLISGSLKTGSAGLFIAFLSFLVIVFVLALPSRGHLDAVRHLDAVPSPGHERSRFRQALPVFWALLSVVVASIVASAVLEGAARTVFGLLAGALGFYLLICLAAMLTFLEKNERSGR